LEAIPERTRVIDVVDHGHMPGEDPTELPPGLDLLWGRRPHGKRGPRPGLSTDAIVDAAIRLADAEGLEAVSMARVAAELGFTTMSLYRHVTSKEELLQLMWNVSSLSSEKLVLGGDDWRSRLRMWAAFQRDLIDRHPWITQMPMASPPLSPNSLMFVEHGFATLDGTGLADTDKLRVIGLLSSYTLSEARMAYDAICVIRQRRRAAASQLRRGRSRRCCGNSSTRRTTRGCTGSPGHRRVRARALSRNTSSSCSASTASWTVSRHSSTRCGLR
jgi:AcrR family transcriptional regulator